MRFYILSGMLVICFFLLYIETKKLIAGIKQYHRAMEEKDDAEN